MSIDKKRSIKSAQVKTRILGISISGTAVAPAASGLDKRQIREVIDNGTGDYTIVLKRPFSKENADNCIAVVTPITKAINCAVVAVDYDRVTVECENYSGIATDADFMLMVYGTDNRIGY